MKPTLTSIQNVGLRIEIRTRVLPNTIQECSPRNSRLICKPSVSSCCIYQLFCVLAAFTCSLHLAGAVTLGPAALAPSLVPPVGKSCIIFHALGGAPFRKAKALPLLLSSMDIHEI
jgi:hypothetical protein